MAKYLSDVSRTFSEYLLIPGLTTEGCTPDLISLKAPLVKFKKGEISDITLNIPFVSAIMQSVSDDNMAIALAKNGGISFIFGSQPIDDQAEMVRKVKKYKAGFVISDANVKPDQSISDMLAIKAKTGHSTFGVTENGKADGKLLGIVTGRDYRPGKDDLNTPVKEVMTPFDKLITGEFGISLTDANDVIWDHKLNCLPIIDKDQNLKYLVFRKDYDEHKENPDELSDLNKKLIVGAGINTRDYVERVPKLIEAGVDVVCIDSSDGFSVWQKETLQYIRSNYGDKVKIGAGNVVDRDGFLYLAEAGADFVKVGVGGGSICITREQKGIGRGQATALIEVAHARDEYFEKTGIYVPICSDGGSGSRLPYGTCIGHGSRFSDDGPLFCPFR